MSNKHLVRAYILAGLIIEDLDIAAEENTGNIKALCTRFRDNLEIQTNGVIKSLFSEDPDTAQIYMNSLRDIFDELL